MGFTWFPPPENRLPIPERQEQIHRIKLGLRVRKGEHKKKEDVEWHVQNF